MESLKECSRTSIESEMEYRKTKGVYAEYYYKGSWRESASVKNEDVDKLNNKKPS